MQPEIWLRPNRRILWFATIPDVVTLVGGLAVALLVDSTAARGAGLLVAAISCVLILLIALAARQPRIGYANRKLLVNLRLRGTIRVPIDCVECFFLGQGPSMLPPHNEGGQPQEEETSNVIVRLAESAEQWQRIEVLPALGHWCDGYITVRGAWCEPITADLLRHLNRQLVEVHRSLRSTQEADPQEAGHK